MHTNESSRNTYTYIEFLADTCAIIDIPLNVNTHIEHQSSDTAKHISMHKTPFIFTCLCFASYMRERERERTYICPLPPSPPPPLEPPLPLPLISLASPLGAPGGPRGEVSQISLSCPLLPSPPRFGDHCRGRKVQMMPVLHVAARSLLTSLCVCSHRARA